MIFGEKHLIGLAVIVALATIFFLVMHFFVNKRGERARVWALRGLALFLLFTEFVKYIMTLHGDGVSSGSIGIALFPFQLCHMPLFLFPFVAFGKSKFSQFLKPGAFIIGMLAGTLTLLYPSNVLDASIGWLDNGGLNFPSISFIYHGTMIVFAIYMLVSKVYKFKASDSLKALAVLCSLAAVAITLNAIIPGADFFMLGSGVGNPLNFIVASAGHAVYLLTMFGMAVLLIALVYSYHITKWIIDKCKARKKIATPAATGPKDNNKVE